MFYTAVLIQRNFQLSTILLVCFTLKNKKQNSLLKVTTSYLRDTLCDYERKSCGRRKQSATKQTKTDT